MQAKESANFPDTKEYEEALEGFPTVGAEFHFSKDAPSKLPNFWQRLAILNMSQYQRDSYVQLSRNDRNVIEVRMNPSIYPITVANWNHLRLLLPELNQTFFTITFNRKNEGNFSWENTDDKALLDKLRTLGMLSYAAMFENVPASKKTEEINFGSIYLGQTVRILNGEYKSSGHWGEGEGKHGQMGIYAGFGDNLPYLAYYPSMVLANPDILESIPRDLFSVKTLNDALAVTSNDRKKAFIALQSRIAADERLNKAFKAGNKIIELLNP